LTFIRFSADLQVKTMWKSELFRLEMFRKKGGVSVGKKLNSVLVPELYALTLLPNRPVVQLLRYLSTSVENGLAIPINSDQWASHWAKAGADARCYSASAPARAKKRKEVLGVFADTPNASALGSVALPSLQHVAVRAYPVRFVSPQTRNAKGTKRLLLLAFDLKRLWFYVQLEPLRSQYELKEAHELAVSPDLIMARQWESFVSRLWNAHATYSLDPLCVHLPEGSQLLKTFGVTCQRFREIGMEMDVVADMPREYQGLNRFQITVKTRSSKVLANVVVDVSAEVASGRQARHENPSADQCTSGT
jgi:hypothetical protein